MRWLARRRGASTVGLNIGFRASPTKLKRSGFACLLFPEVQRRFGSLVPLRGVTLDFLYPFDEFFIRDLVRTTCGFMDRHACSERLSRGLLVIHATPLPGSIRRLEMGHCNEGKTIQPRVCGVCMIPDTSSNFGRLRGRATLIVRLASFAQRLGGYAHAGSATKRAICRSRFHSARTTRLRRCSSKPRRSPPLAHGGENARIIGQAL